VKDIHQVLKFIEEQLEAAERLSRFRAQIPKPVQISQPTKTTPTPTASQLGATASQLLNLNLSTDPGEIQARLQGEKQQPQLQRSQRYPAYSAKRCIVPNGAERKKNGHHQRKKMFLLFRSSRNSRLL
jgi:hypothetical protein